MIVTENEIGEYFYIIEEGKVECSKYDEESKQAKFIWHLVSGDYFGELALINDSSKRTLSVKALEDTKCITISRNMFIFYLSEFKEELKKKHYLF